MTERLDLHSEGAAQKKSPFQLRHEAVEIVQRHKRGLSGIRRDKSPSPSRPARATAERSLQEGRDHLMRGNIAEALLRADAAIGLAAPGSSLLADSWTLHGRVRLLQGNPQAARAAFGRALDVNLAHYEARLGLAEAYRAMQSPRRAVPLYLEAVSLVTDDAERGRIRRLLSDTYREAGQPHAARRVLLAQGDGRLPAQERLLALARAFLPTSVAGWLLLLGLLLLAAYLVAQPGMGVAAGLLLFAALLYVVLLWRRASGHTRKPPR